MPLSDQLSARVGGKTNRGTTIDRQLVSRIKADEAVNLRILEDNSDLIARSINKALILALEECGLDGERFAKDNLTKNRSVDTGRLRASVTHQIMEREKAVYIGTNVEYAPYVEYRKPYLYPAARDHAETYKEVFRKHLGRYQE